MEVALPHLSSNAMNDCLMSIGLKKIFVQELLVFSLVFME